MSKENLALFSAFLGFGMLAAMPAKAVLFNLDQSCSTCGGLATFGTVEATNDGANLKIVETLASGVFFNNASPQTMRCFLILILLLALTVPLVRSRTAQLLR